MRPVPNVSAASVPKRREKSLASVCCFAVKLVPLVFCAVTGLLSDFEKVLALSMQVMPCFAAVLV